MRWRRANRSELPPVGAEVTYDWPDGGGDPFDVADGETRWVLVAGQRFGRTWPAGDRRDFGSTHPDFEHRVRVGYTVIQLAERLAVVERGRVLREWPQSGLTASGYPPIPPILDPHPHYIPGWADSGTYAALDGTGRKLDAAGRPVGRQHDSYAAALAESMGMKDRRVLVVRILETKNWH